MSLESQSEGYCSGSQTSGTIGLQKVRKIIIEPIQKKGQKSYMKNVNITYHYLYL